MTEEFDEGDVRKNPVINKHQTIKDFSKMRRLTVCSEISSQLSDLNANLDQNQMCFE
jgi:hypothetical protein